MSFVSHISVSPCSRLYVKYRIQRGPNTTSNKRPTVSLLARTRSIAEDSANLIRVYCCWKSVDTETSSRHPGCARSSWSSRPPIIAATFVCKNTFFLYHILMSVPRTRALWALGCAFLALTTPVALAGLIIENDGSDLCNSNLRDCSTRCAAPQSFIFTCDSGGTFNAPQSDCKCTPAPPAGAMTDGGELLTSMEV